VCRGSSRFGRFATLDAKFGFFVQIETKLVVKVTLSIVTSQRL
jgi:hypothetical protein